MMRGSLEVSGDPMTVRLIDSSTFGKAKGQLLALWLWLAFRKHEGQQIQRCMLLSSCRAQSFEDSFSLLYEMQASST